MKRSEIESKVKLKIREFKLATKNCGCKKTSTGICEHFNFAKVFPEYIPFWADTKDPLKFHPNSESKIKFKCKLNCKDEVFESTVWQFTYSIGCRNCKGKNARIIPFDSCILSDPVLTRMWSNKNTKDPRLVNKFGGEVCLWICDNGHERKTEARRVLNRVCKKCPEWHKNLKWIEVLERCKNIWGDTYEYDALSFKNSKTPMAILCKINNHGVFYKTERSHNRRKEGCPKCFKHNIRSKLLMSVEKFFIDLKIPIKEELSFEDFKSNKGRKYRFDIFVEKYNLIIEVDGEQHFRSVDYFGGLDEFKERKISDLLKDKYAIKKGFNFIRIPEWIIENNINDLFINILYLITLGRKLYASYSHYSNFVNFLGYEHADWVIPPKYYYSIAED